MTVVSDLKQLQTSIFDQDLNGGGSSIDRVLEHLLQSIHGGHDDFASSDLVDDIGSQWLF